MLTESELLQALVFLLEVHGGKHKDVRFKTDFREQHPNYRLYQVDTEPPLTSAPEPQRPQPMADWRELLVEHERRTGRALRPVRRKAGSFVPPAGCRCEHCGAPEQWLYINDGVKRSQLRCRICKALSPVCRSRHHSNGPYWCPYCTWALYRWKHDEDRTIYKCPNDNCPHYVENRNRLNDHERQLAGTGMSSQFKLRYQWREYHFDPANVQPHAPHSTARSLLNIRQNLNAVGLALAYCVSLGLSLRMTSRALRQIHGIKASHETVRNWLDAAAGPAWCALQSLKGKMHEMAVAADETYIKVLGVWHYTWFVIGTETRTIWAWEVSDDRGEMPAVAVINHTLQSRPKDLQGTLVLIGDGNGAYDAASNAVNIDADGAPLPVAERKVERRTVVGIKNNDEQSRQFRVFKQLIERLNRTYRYHTRSRSGHKSLNGARALTTLFVAHYNFLRPHGALHNKPPVQLPELQDIETLQGRWLKLLQLAA